MIKSLKFKFIVVLFMVVISIISLFVVLGAFFLEPYYTYKEKAEFVNIYNSISHISNVADLSNTLSKFSIDPSITIMVSDKDFTEIYSSTNIFNRNNPRSRDILRFFGESFSVPENEPYFIKIIDDPLGDQRLSMAGKLPLDYTIYLSKPIKSIKYSINIYNDFLILVSLLVLVFGGIAMFMIGNKFSNPIYEMVDISKRITNLDFSKKYHINGEDELNMLGECINTMSDTLSENIVKLSQANIDLKNDLSQKERNEEMRKEFLQNASHELKTPISVIASYSEMLKDKIITDEDDLEYYYNVIYDETGKMSEIVRNLLGLAQLESQNRSLNLEKFNLSELLLDIIPSYSGILEKSNKFIISNIQNDIFVNADRFLIERVISNYISNGIEHASGHDITVTLEKWEDEVRFSVANDTVGKLDREKVYSSFYKGVNSQGTGLGLSIVKAIMTSHNKDFGFIEENGRIEFYIKL